jgi:hypothetical protein
MGLAASESGISQRISHGNMCESGTLRGRETVLGRDAGKVGHANAARLKSTASRCAKDGEPYALKGACTVREGGHAIPFGSTVPTSQLQIQLLATANQTLATQTAQAAAYQRAEVLDKLARSIVVESYRIIEAERWNGWPSF